MSIRAEKIGSVIKRSLAVEVLNIASENSFGFASISAVRVSKDLSIAKIYFSLLGTKKTPEEFLKILNKNKGRLRSLVASEVRMRFVPELRFFYDDTLEQIEQINSLVEKVKTEAPYKENYGDTSVYDEKILEQIDSNSTTNLDINSDIFENKNE